MGDISYGKKLLIEKNLRQGSYFKAIDIPEEVRKEWIDFRISCLYRKDVSKNLIKNEDLILIVSQDCDIACSVDSQDPYLECAILKPISESNVYIGNQYANSVRKLQVKVDNSWYEAKNTHLTYIEKKSLLALFEKNNIEINNMGESETKTVPYWRANRYLRTALPDNFNGNLISSINEYKEVLRDNFLDQDNKSYIRGIYLKINSHDELDNYTFEIFCLLKQNTPDKVLTEIQDLINNISDKLCNNFSYEEYENCIYADRESSVLVSFLISFMRVNFDHLSLSNNDNEFGDNI